MVFTMPWWPWVRPVQRASAPVSAPITTPMATGAWTRLRSALRAPRWHGLTTDEYAPCSEVGLLVITPGRSLPSSLSARSVWVAIIEFSDGSLEWLSLAAQGKPEAVEQMELVIKRHPRRPSIRERSIRSRGRISFDLSAEVAANHR